MAGKGRWQVAWLPEALRGRATLLSCTALGTVATLLMVTPSRAQPAANARPTGGQVSAGSASISNSASTTRITQSSQRTAINWQSFNVGSQQTVDFVQPSASSVALNRVISSNPSRIAGRIDANGQIILLNQSGVIFDRGSQVNTAGLIVSAAGMSNVNFMAGRLVFDQAGNPNAAVVNQGTLTVKQAGLAALVAPQVANSGVINATLGHVVLAGAKTATLDMYGDGLVSLDVNNAVVQAPVGPDGKAVTALVTNTGVIQASGGTVQLTAREADGLVQNLVQAGGTIAANSVGGKTGTIVLGGLGGSIALSGVVMADGTGAGSRGGAVQVDASGGVALAAGSRVSASGAADGGTVAIGTTLARAKGGPGVASALTAQTVDIAAGASVAANATSKGDGGRVTVLSLLSTSMAGDISATGGPRGGNGGFVETSGASLGIASTAVVDALALSPTGKAGTWLLDPGDIIVATGGGASLTDVGTFGAKGGSTQTIDPSTIDGAGANVTLQAKDSITFTNAIDMTTIGVGLTAQAGNNIAVNAGITTSGGNILLSANDPATTQSGSGGVTVSAAISTTGSAQTGGTITLQVTGGTGTVSLGANVATGSAGSVDLISPNAITQTAGSIATNTLTGSAASAGLSGVTNLVGTLGAFTTSAGFALTDNEALAVSGGVSDTGVASTLALTTKTAGITLAGNASATNVLDLVSAGTISQSGGSISVGTLTGSSSSGTTLTVATNAISTIGPFTATTGNIAIKDASAATIGGLINAAAGNVYLESSAGGGITFGAFTVESVAGGTVGLQTNALVNLGTTGATGVINAGAAGTFELSPDTANPITLGTASGLSLTNLTGITAGELRIGAVTQPGDASATIIGNSIVVGGAFGSSSVALELDSKGGINGSGFALTASTLTGNAQSASLTDNANLVATLGSFTTSAGFALTDNEALTVNGPVSDTGAASTLAVTTKAGDITLAGNVSATNVLDLVSAGTISQTAGSISAGTLTGSAATSASLTQATNLVGTLGAFTSTAGFALTDNESLLVNGAVSDSGAASTLALTTTTGDITLGANVSATNVLDLVSAGTISQTGGSISVGTLTGSAVTSASLTQAKNLVGTLGTFSTDGGFALTDNESLLVNGAVTDTGATSTLALTTKTGDLTLAGNVSATNVLDLVSAGTISQTGGSISAGTLTGSATTSASLTEATNLVGTLGAFTSTAGFALTDNEALLVNGAVSDTGATTTLALTTDTGGLTLAGNVSATNVVDLVSAGTINQSGGSISAGTLTVSTTGAGDVTLGAANQIGVDSGITVNSGDLELVDNASLTLTGAQSANNLFFEVSATTGTLHIGSAGTGATLTASAASSPRISLVANRITEGAATSTITAAGGTVELAPFTSGTVVSLAGTPGARLLIDSALLGDINTGLVSVGQFTNVPGGGALTVSAGNMTLDGVVDLTGIASALGLFSKGAISEPTGPITVGTLTGSAGTSASLAKGNLIGTLAAFSSTAGFALTDGQSLTVIGPVSDTGAATTLALTTTTGDITLAGNVSATNVLDIVSAGTVGQTAGSISAGSLTGSATTSASLTQTTNLVGKLGAFTTSTGFALTDNEALLVSGIVADSGTGQTVALTTETGGITLGNAINAGNDTFAIVSAGSISQSGGLIDAATLTGSAASSASLTRLTNQVGTLAAFSTSTGFALVDNEALVVNGVVADSGTGQTVALTTKNGAITLSSAINAGDDTFDIVSAGSINQNGGSIDVATLTGSAGTSASVTQATNLVGTLGAFSTTKGFALTDNEALLVNGVVADTGTGQTVALSTDTGGITLSGTIAAVHDTLDLISAGSVVQNGGSINVTTLTGSIANAATLMQASNVVGTLGAFTTGGNFDLEDTSALTINGAVDASAGNVYLESSSVGGITFAAAATVDSVAGGTISLQTNLLTGLGVAGAAVDAGATGTFEFAPNTANPVTLSSGSAAGVTAGLIRIGGVTVPGSGETITATSITVATSFGSAASDLELDSKGAISQAAGAILTADTLFGQALGAVTLTQANAVSNLGSFGVTGAAFSLTDSGLVGPGPGGALTVSGPVTATNVNISGAPTIIATGSIGATTDLVLFSGAGGLHLNTGEVLSGATVDLSSGGNGVTQVASGTIIASTVLQSSSGVDGTVVLAGTANTIASVGAFVVTGGDFTLVDTGNLVVAGSLSADNVSLSSATITATGSVTAATDLVLAGGAGGIALNTGEVLSGPTVDLSSGGGVTQAASGSVVAGTLTSSGGITGTLSLVSVTNQIGTVSGITVTNGDIVLVDNTALTLAGVQSAGNLFYEVNLAGSTLQVGSDTIGATLTATAGSNARISLVADNISEGAATSSIATNGGTAGTGSVELAQFGSTVEVSLGGASGSDDVIGASLSGIINTGTVNIGRYTNVPGGGGFKTTADGIVVTGLFDLTNHASELGLYSLASISEATGTLIVGSLNGSAVGSANLAQANNLVGTLAGFSTTAGFVLADNEALAVNGPVRDTGTGQTVSLTTGTGDLTLNGVITAGNDTLVLSSAGSVLQTGGSIDVATLTGSAVSAVSLTQAGNLVGTLGAFSTTLGFVLADNEALLVNGLVSDTGVGQAVVLTTETGGITLTGTIAAASDTLDLTSAGGISQTAGSIDVATLTGSAVGAASLTQASNLVGTLSAFNTTAGFALDDAESLLVNGPVADSGSGKTVALTVNPGNITLSGAINAGGDTLDLSAAGSITQTAGTIQVATLTGVAGDSVSLTQSLNQVGTLGAFSSATGFTLTDNEALLVNGLVSNSQGAELVTLRTGTGGITLTGTIAAAGDTLQLISAGAISQTGGSIDVTALTGSAVTSASLTQPTNLVGNVGPFTTGTGFALTSNEALAVDGVVSDSGSGQTVALTTKTGGITLFGTISAAGDTLDLVSAGSISQNGGSIDVATLTGSAGTSASLMVPSNLVVTLGAFSTTLGFALVDNHALLVNGVVSDSGTGQTVAITTGTGGITLNGTVAAANDTLDLVSAAGIIQIGGSIDVATLTGSAATGAGLTQVSNLVGTLGAFSTALGFALTDNEALLVNGVVSDSGSGQTVVLTTKTGGLTLASAINAAGDTLDLSSAGGITQTGGSIDVATVTGSAVGAASLTQVSNLVGTLGAFTSTAGFALVDNQPLLVNGVVSDSGSGQAVVLDSETGGLTLASAINAAGDTLDLISAGAITQSGGSIQVATLTGSAVGAASLTQASNLVGTLGAFSSTLGFALTDNEALLVNGPVADSGTGQTVVLTTGTGGITLSSAINAGGDTLDLVSAGAITQNGGSIDVASLTGSAVGAAGLTQLGNVVGTLGAFSSDGGFALVDSGALLVNGVLSDSGSGQTVALTTKTSGLTLASAINAGGDTLDLTSAGSISQTGGSIDVATLTGSAVSSASLGQASNLVGTLGAFSTATGFTLTDNEALLVNGLVSNSQGARLVILTTGTGGITLSGTVAASGDTLDVVSAGAISQTGGSIDVTALTGSAVTSASLTQATNLVSNLGPFSTGSGFALTSNEALSVDGVVSDSGSGQTVALTTKTGDLTLLSSINAGGDTLDLVSAGAISQTGGSIDVASLTGSAATGASLTQVSNLVGTLGAFTSAAGFALVDNQALLVNGVVADSGTGQTVALTTETGGLTLLSSINAGGDTLDLVSAGAINQTGGSVDVATLTGSAATGASLTQASNLVGTLGAFTTTAGFALTDDEALLVNGVVADSGTRQTVVLTTGTGEITLASAIDAGGDTLDLVSAGGISQTGGSIDVATLTGSAAGSATLTQVSNLVGTLGAFTSTAGFALVDNEALLVNGVVSDSGTGQTVALTTKTGGLTLASAIDAGGDTLDLVSAGAISQTGGSIQVATLTGSAATSASLNQASNLVGILGAFATATGFSLVDNEVLAVTGTVSDSGTGQTVALTTDTGGITLSSAINAGGDTLDLVSAGAITQTGGSIQVATLTGGAVGAASLTQTGNRVVTLNGFSTGGGLALVDNEALTVAGAVSDSGTGKTVALTTEVGGITLSGVVTAANDTLDLVSAGSISQLGGQIDVATVTGSAATSASLTQASNLVGTLGSFSTTTGFRLVDNEALAVTGTVGDTGTGQTVALTTDTGGITLSGVINAGGDTLDLVSAGAISQTGGSISVATLTGSAATNASLTQVTNLVGTLGAFTTTAGFALTDNEALVVNGTLADSGTGQTVALTTKAGGLTLASAINVGGDTLDLVSAGGISQTGGSIDVLAMTGSAATSASLTEATNLVGTLAAFTTSTGFALVDNEALAVTGAVADSGTGQTVALTTKTGAITLSGAINAGGDTLDIVSAGSIGQSGGSIDVATLTGSAGTSASLTQTSNLVNTLDAFNTTTGFALRSNEALAVNGAVSDSGSGQQILLVTDTGGITLNSAISAAGDILDLVSAGVINQTGGAINVASLTGSAAGSASLTQAGNLVGALNEFSTNGGLALVDNEALLVLGVSESGTGKTVALTTETGGITFSGDVDVINGTLDLVSAGSITQVSQQIDVATLTGSAATSVSLSNETNLIGTLGAFTTTAGFALANTQGLIVNGPVTDTGAGQTVALTTTAGGITLSGSINAANDTLDIVAAGGINQTGGAIDVATLTGSAAGAASLTQTGNLVSTLGAFSSGAGFALVDDAALTVNGPLTDTGAGQTVSLTTENGGITLAGAVNAGGDTFNLVSAGAIAQTGGSIDVATLTGSAATSASLTQPTNLIGTVGTFTTGAGFTLVDDEALTVAGPLTDNGTGDTVALTTEAGGMTFTGTIAAARDTLDLVSATSIDQTGGVLDPVVLTGSAGTTVDLEQLTNQVGTLGAFTAATFFKLTDDEALTITGPLTSPLIVINDQTFALTLASGATLNTGGTVPPNPLSITPTEIPSNPPAGSGGVGAYFTSASFQQLGASTVNTTTGSPNSILFVTTPHGGNVTFAGLTAPDTWLIVGLDAPGSVVSGNVVVKSLTVQLPLNTTPSDFTVDLSGTVNGITGQAAAGQADVVPAKGATIRFNNCPIGTVGCVLLSSVPLPVGNPLQFLTLGILVPPNDEGDLLLPLVSDEDFLACLLRKDCN